MQVSLVIKGAMALVYAFGILKAIYQIYDKLIQGDSPSCGSGSNKFKGSYYLEGVLFKQLF